MTLLKDKLMPFKATHDPYKVAYLTGEFGNQVSPPYWYGMLKGTKDNPSRKRIGAMATMFQVPWRYLADDGVDTPLAAALAETETLGSRKFLNLFFAFHGLAFFRFGCDGDAYIHQPPRRVINFGII